jgi:hypothetical protein
MLVTFRVAWALCGRIKRCGKADCMRERPDVRTLASLF